MLAIEPVIQSMVKVLIRLRITVPVLSAIILICSLVGAALLWLSDGKIYLLLLVPYMLAFLSLINLLNARLAAASQNYSQASAQHQREIVLTDITAIVSEWIYYFPFVIHVTHHILPMMSVGIFLFLMVASEYIGVLMRYLLGERHYDGPLPRAGRALLVIIYSLFIYFDPERAAYGIWFFSLGDILLLLTCFNRLKPFWFSSFSKA